MRFIDKHRLFKWVATAACALAPALAAAAFPSRPITLVVPFPPGGGNDQIGRLVAAQLATELKVPVVVENRGGAGGNIGVAMVARSRPDGHTLVIASNQVVINTSLYADVGFDLHKDLRPVSMIADVQFLLVAHPGAGFKRVADIVAAVKGGARVGHGTPGNGTPQHLSAELFGTLTGAPLSHVPYRGSGPAIADVLGGHIPLAFATLPAVAPHVQAGKLTAIAATGKSRSALLPDVPTLAESGVAGYESSTWYGLLAPANTPDDVIATIDAALKRIVGSASVRSQLKDLGYEARYLGPDAMGKVMNADESKWAGIIKSVGIKVE